MSFIASAAARLVSVLDAALESFAKSERQARQDKKEIHITDSSADTEDEEPETIEIRSSGSDTEESGV